MQTKHETNPSDTDELFDIESIEDAVQTAPNTVIEPKSQLCEYIIEQAFLTHQWRLIMGLVTNMYFSEQDNAPLCSVYINYKLQCDAAQATYFNAYQYLDDYYIDSALSPSDVRREARKLITSYSDEPGNLAQFTAYFVDVLDKKCDNTDTNSSSTMDYSSDSSVDLCDVVDEKKNIPYINTTLGFFSVNKDNQTIVSKPSAIRNVSWADYSPDVVMSESPEYKADIDEPSSSYPV